MAEQRFSELDALRGFAALAVVFRHYTWHAVLYFHDFPFKFSAGGYGVQLFFCISGFVIFWTLNRSSHLLDFAFSRFSRLYPSYWAAIALCALVAVTHGQTLSLTQYAVNATMLQTYLRVPYVDVVFWTLAIELVFYVWMGLLFALGLQRKMVHIAGVWLALSATAAIAARFVTLPSWIDTYFIVSSIPFFLAGVTFYLISVEGWKRAYVAVIACALVVAGLKGRGELAVAALIFAAFAVAVAGRLRWIVNPVTVWLGAISYALYLTHQSVWDGLLFAVDGLPSWAAVLAMLAFALAVASVITYCIERPAMRWLRGWYKRRRSAPVAAEVGPPACG